MSWEDWEDHEDDVQPEECGVSITVGPAHDPYGTSCYRLPGHKGKHRGSDPFGAEGDVEWFGGGSCAGDPLPIRELRSVPQMPEGERDQLDYPHNQPLQP